jgi:hypothetical protein
MAEGRASGLIAVSRAIAPESAIKSPAASSPVTEVAAEVRSADLLRFSVARAAEIRNKAAGGTQTSGAGEQLTISLTVKWAVNK